MLQLLQIFIFLLLTEGRNIYYNFMLWRMSELSRVSKSVSGRNATKAPGFFILTLVFFAADLVAVLVRTCCYNIIIAI